jgi:glycosyltransferase involved in cell wall biosynthesis
MPKVTVVTPNFNHARFLPQRFDSILTQTFQDFELIVLDNASTDNSREIIESYAKDPRVRPIFNAENNGSTFRQWNLGLGHARGDYVWFAESDDYADPLLLETLVDRLDRHPNVGLAFCQSWVIDAEGNLLYNYLETLEQENDTIRWRADYINSGHDECPNYLFWRNTIPNASAVLLRRHILERAGGPPKTMLLYGDLFTYINVLSISDIAFVSSPLNYFRQHQNNVRSRVSGKESASEHLRVQELLIRRYGLPRRFRDDDRTLAEYVNTWVGTRRQPPHNKVPLGHSLALLSSFAHMHPKALKIGLSILAWEQMADLARRVGLLGPARKLKNALAKTTYVHFPYGSGMTEK